jgi:hypothetical protein
MFGHTFERILIEDGIEGELVGGLILSLLGIELQVLGNPIQTIWMLAGKWRHKDGHEQGNPQAAQDKGAIAKLSRVTRHEFQ